MSTDPTAMSSGGRSRGRPSIGPSVPIRLSDEDKLFAEALGKGVAAEGVRLAIRAADKLGPNAVLTLLEIAQASAPVSPSVPKGRGRPKIGKPFPARLCDEDADKARLLGKVGKVEADEKTVLAEGARRAIKVCKYLGLEPFHKLVSGEIPEPQQTGQHAVHMAN